MKGYWQTTDKNRQEETSDKRQQEEWRMVKTQY